MKLLVRYAAAAVLLVAVLSSCKNRTPHQAKLIPKTASVVLVLDAKAMQDKLQKGGLSVDSLFENFYRRDKDDSAHKAKINDLRKNAGISWNSQLYFFVSNKPGKSAQESINVFNVMGSLNDPSKFEAFLKRQDDLKNKEIKKENGYSYVLADDGVVLSWNDRYLMATIYNQNARPVYDSVSGSFKKPETGNIAENAKGCDAVDSVEATSVAAELLRSFSANLNARSRDPLAVGSAIRLSGQAPDGTPVEAMVLVASRGSRVVQATGLRTQRIGAADAPRRIGPGGLAPQDDQRTVQLPAEAAEAFISSLRWQ